MQHSFTLKPVVKAWLILGLIMIFMQIILGGITRLTGSGLSITKWDIVTGAIPPLNAAQWNEQFELYKNTPQYQKINQGMTLEKFKWIFFWEYAHRLWARSMGFVFLIPLVFFWVKGFLSKALKTDLFIVFILSGIVGIFGWIMVASGLVNRPWVNAYKLSMHLGLALIALGYLFWTYLKAVKNSDKFSISSGNKTVSLVFLILVCIQILLGGMMSGMKAALMYPTFPKMGGHWIDPVIFEASSWQIKHFIDYDVYSFLPALVQLLHRSMAMSILVLFIIAWQKWNGKVIKWIALILGLQILLGIFTLINSIGKIPLSLGVFHQAVGIVLLLAAVRWYFECSRALDK